MNPQFLIRFYIHFTLIFHFHSISRTANKAFKVNDPTVDPVEWQKWASKMPAPEKAFEVKDCPTIGGKGLFIHHKYRGKIAAKAAVIEYMGERIDKNEYERRLDEYQNDGTFNYMVPAVKGWYIDATRKGNWARYVNHSCDPNCALEDSPVNGERAVMLVCFRDMRAGTEVTIDYGKDYMSVDGKYIRCLCKTRKCSGIIGVKIKELPEIMLKMQDEISVLKGLPAPIPAEENEEQVVEEEIVVENGMENQQPQANIPAGDHSYSADEVSLLTKDSPDKQTSKDKTVTEETTAPVPESEEQTGFDRNSYFRLMEENLQLRRSQSQVSMQLALILQMVSNMQIQSIANFVPVSYHNMGMMHHAMAANAQMQGQAHPHRMQPYQRTAGDNSQPVRGCQGFRRNGQKVFFY
jgi:hypothetical protein